MLVKNWPAVIKHAWSFRLIALSVGLGAVELGLPYLDGELPLSQRSSTLPRLRPPLVPLDERTGADQAHKWIIGEEGMEAKPFSVTAENSQHIEMRKHQIEDIARPFSVPRPLLGVDDTSWGSGIDVLGQFFVRYALNPWFEAWQQAIERSLLTEAEQELYEVKFNDGALLRGSMKDQAEFFAKGLGSGGSRPFLHEDEVRNWMDLPHRDDLPPPPGQTQTGRGMQQ